MKVEELAKQYRDGGEFTNEAKVIQYEEVLNRMDHLYSVYQTYEHQTDELTLSFGTYIGLQLSHWEADNGFVRASGQVKERLERFADKPASEVIKRIGGEK